MIEVKCMGPIYVMERPEKLTGGMVGKKIRFTFDGVWDGLARQAGDGADCGSFLKGAEAYPRGK